jgi:hypothetical protein
MALARGTDVSEEGIASIFRVTLEMEASYPRRERSSTLYGNFTNLSEQGVTGESKVK